MNIAGAGTSNKDLRCFDHVGGALAQKGPESAKVGIVYRAGQKRCARDITRKVGYVEDDDVEGARGYRPETVAFIDNEPRQTIARIVAIFLGIGDRRGVTVSLDNRRGSAR